MVKRMHKMPAFAQAYSWNGTTMISFRGTDSLLDIVTDWGTGGGAIANSQALMAAQFYKAVVGNDRYGANVYEAPGEAHTLVADPDVEEMITMFQINGTMIYVDPDSRCLGYDDVFTRLDKCRARYAANGLGADYADQFIR